MTELSNVVTVLIARMESHPEDFDTRGLGHVKFRGVADALDCLAGLTGMDKSAGNVYWFLTDTDKEALIEAWKKYHRTAMEKEVMELVFDEDYYERKEKERLYEEQMKQQMYQHRYIPDDHNPARTNSQNNLIGSGLFSNAGSAFQGIFGSSK